MEDKNNDLKRAEYHRNTKGVRKAEALDKIGELSMKMIELGRGHVDIEHDGETYRLGGELGDGFLAWRKGIKRLISKDQTAPLTEEEQDQVMCNVEKYWNDDEPDISFYDDEDRLICATRAIVAKIETEYIDFMYRRKIIRVQGKKRFNTYRLKTEKIEGVDSGSTYELTGEEKNAFLEEAVKFCHRGYYYRKRDGMVKETKIVFVDKKGKKIKMPNLEDKGSAD